MSCTTFIQGKCPVKYPKNLLNNVFCIFQPLLKDIGTVFQPNVCKSQDGSWRIPLSWQEVPAITSGYWNYFPAKRLQVSRRILAYSSVLARSSSHYFRILKLLSCQTFASLKTDLGIFLCLGKKFQPLLRDVGIIFQQDVCKSQDGSWHIPLSWQEVPEPCRGTACRGKRNALHL